jgi:hypothetical protein
MGKVKGNKNEISINFFYIDLGTFWLTGKLGKI